MENIINFSTYSLVLFDHNNQIHTSVMNDLWLDNNTQKYLYNQKEFINNILNGNDKNDSIYLIKMNNNYIGFISLYSYDEKTEVSIGLLNEYRNKGYSSMVLKDFSYYVLSHTNISKLYAYIDPSNKASIKVALKVGYVNTKDKEYVLQK